ncbi:hypothetical protein M758_11G009800 [Ceratodon purpureus]|nr:hypothetical protein M758_11G009800 [Ceratodon purpureus]
MHTKPPRASERDRERECSSQCGNQGSVGGASREREGSLNGASREREGSLKGASRERRGSVRGAFWCFTLENLRFVIYRTRCVSEREEQIDTVLSSRFIHK